MITFTSGNLLECKAEALINTVNCVGVMGKGIALQFKERFPDNFRAYYKACKAKEVQLGKMFVYETQSLTGPYFIINFPTKGHWRSGSRLCDVEAGLDNLLEVIKKYKISSIAIPPLGCGLGGLDWPAVKGLIESKLGVLSDVDITVYQPGLVPTTLAVGEKKEPKMTEGRAVMVTLIEHYLKAFLDPQITLLELHKLMYFSYISGMVQKLRFVKAPYGPYAENLRHVLNDVEGYLIAGNDGTESPDRSLFLLPGAFEKAQAYLDGNDEIRSRLNRVIDLVHGFESSFGMELLATVHWVLTHTEIESRADVYDAVYSWNEHKKEFSHRHIDIACDTLKAKNWL